MMKIAILALSLAVATMPVAPTMAQTVAAKPTTKCGRLADQWRGYEVDLANNHADGAADDSVPRATMRDVEDSATFTQAQITLELMEVNKCALPDGPPAYLVFFSEALSCRLARMKATLDQLKAGVPECDSKNWKGQTPQ
jgi:hypothetical protein